MQLLTQPDSSVAAPATVDHQQYLTFLLAGEVFALGILAIREIIEYGQLTPVPMMPAFVRGVINLRGAVVPVIDMQARFGRGRTEPKQRTCVVIVEVAGEEGAQQFGVLVDAVNEVLEIPAADIEPTPSFGTRIRSDFISGMGKVEGRFVILLNVASVLSQEEMAEQAAETTSLPAVIDNQLAA